MPVRLTIDTCTWINLASGLYDDNDEVLTRLELMVNTGKVILLVPQPIIDEWNKHKIPTILGRITSSVSGKVKHFKELETYLSEQEVSKLREVIKSVTSNEDYFKATSEKRIHRIDALFEFKTTEIIPVIDEIKLKATDLALRNVKPFAPKKNSMGDALIFLTSIEYMRGIETPLFFVTDNSSDFGAQDKTKLHDDLVRLTENVFVRRKEREIRLEFRYFINIARALNSISADIIRPETEKAIEQRRQHEYFQTHTIQCQRCGTVLTDTPNGMWRPSAYGGGLSWWLVCHKCGAAYDTGDFLD